MKASQFLLTAALFTGLATWGIAGPGAQYWIRQSPATTDRKVEVKISEATNPMACPTCKVTAIEEFKSINPNGRPPHRQVKVGTQHDCALCGGSITTVNGKTTNSMRAICSMGGKDAASCCKVTPATETKKT